MLQSTQEKIFRLCVSAIVALPVASSFALLPASAEFLKGTVQDTDMLGGGNPNSSLNRGDMTRPSDAFAQPPQQDQAIDAPAIAFQVPTIAPPPPGRRPLNGNVQDEGGQPNFSQMQARPDMAPQFQQQQPNYQQPPQQGFAQQQPQDPDDSEEMKLAWDQWHHNVAQNIYERFNSLSNKFFARGCPLMASISYTVTRDGHIINAHLTQKSPNIIFNTMLLTVVNSLNGNTAVLQFPQGSHRMQVDKAGEFQVGFQNVDGFKYLTGDRETVRNAVPHRQMMQQGMAQQRPMMMPPQFQQQQYQQQPQQFQQMQR